MGLDLSLTSTGVSVNGETTSIRPTSRGTIRLIEIRDTLLALLAEHQTQIVAVEGYSFASRNSHAHALGELGGVIRVVLHERGVRLVVVPPTVRAKFATGKGNAGKSEVVSAISAKTGIIWSGGDGDDRCDAWVLEQMLLLKLGENRYAWGKAQMDALGKVDWSGLNG